MILHKILHIKQPVAEAMATLLDARAYRSQLEDIHRLTCLGSGESAWTVSLKDGHTADLRITKISSECPGIVLFKSLSGDIQVKGMIEFVTIRENLTQIEFTLEYRINSFFARWADRFTKTVEKFADRQLGVIRSYLHGVEVKSLALKRDKPSPLRRLQTRSIGV